LKTTYVVIATIAITLFNIFLLFIDTTPGKKQKVFDNQLVTYTLQVSGADIPVHEWNTTDHHHCVSAIKGGSIGITCYPVKQ